MWSSEQDSNTTNPNPRNRTFGSSSSSSRSSPSSNASIIFPQTPRRSMEDVWKDISLMTPLQNHYHGSSNHYHPNHHHNHHQNQFHLSNKSNSFKGMILQDFLAGPLNRPLSVSPPIEDPHTLPPIPTPNLPPTSLSLNSGLDFGYLGNSLSSNSSSGDSRVTGRATETSSFISPALNDMIMGPSSPGNILSFCSKKRVPEGSMVGGDRRQKRMIKNRESAARSRARKLAQTNEMERTVQTLTQENEKLRKQYDQLRHSIVGQQSIRNTLQRSTSSPF
ncbi:Basic-leucine zipper (bZIP) transcription factor family protein [Rhynchospora pubera]|uniref:Basic-leucine zipper (BZIP) transcription factor family protein n=1 Tax=Rhynchospora pubera TaxID=906938 RepID=A0AAV8CVD7_9POAL|nr:Basic-leucine zipper (bZIP) transcription factor family protein [Rhynchospora pubera]